MDFFRISITVVSAITITLCESVVADVSAKDTTTPKIILASYDEFPITPYQLVTEAVQIIEKNYLDSSFNGLDWQQVKKQTLACQYATKEEAYTAIDSGASSSWGRAKKRRAIA